MTAPKLRAIARILSELHVDLGNAMEPLFDDPNADPIVKACTQFFDKLNEFESLVKDELGKLVLAELDARTPILSALALSATDRAAARRRAKLT